MFEEEREKRKRKSVGVGRESQREKCVWERKRERYRERVCVRICSLGVWKRKKDIFQSFLGPMASLGCL
jgi:hypothetical protein